MPSAIAITDVTKPRNGVRCAGSASLWRDRGPRMPRGLIAFVIAFASVGCAGTNGADVALDGSSDHGDGTIAIAANSRSDATSALDAAASGRDASQSTQADAAADANGVDFEPGRDSVDSDDGSNDDATDDDAADDDAADDDAADDDAAELEPDVGPGDAMTDDDVVAVADGSGTGDSDAGGGASTATDGGSTDVTSDTADTSTAPACAATIGNLNASIPAPPLPTGAPCAWSPPLFFKGPPPAETLTVTLGKAAYGTKPWTQLEDKAWLGMFHGLQGSFHSFAAFRVKMPGITKTYAKLQVEAWLGAACGVVALGKQPLVYAKPVVGQPDVWGNAEAGEIGVFLFYGVASSKSATFCNTWATLHVRVRQVGTDAWGSASALVRLYDSKKK